MVLLHIYQVYQIYAVKNGISNKIDGICYLDGIDGPYHVSNNSGLVSVKNSLTNPRFKHFLVYSNIYYVTGMFNGDIEEISRSKLPGDNALSTSVIYKCLLDSGYSIFSGYEQYNIIGVANDKVINKIKEINNLNLSKVKDYISDCINTNPNVKSSKDFSDADKAKHYYEILTKKIVEMEPLLNCHYGQVIVRDFIVSVIKRDPMYSI